jgi:hypothetical protein
MWGKWRLFHNTDAFKLKLKDVPGAGTPIILATWEAEIRRITVWGQPGQIVCKTLLQNYQSKLDWRHGSRDRAPVLQAWSHELKPISPKNEMDGDSYRLTFRSYLAIVHLLMCSKICVIKESFLYISYSGSLFSKSSFTNVKRNKKSECCPKFLTFMRLPFFFVSFFVLFWDSV